MEVPYMKEFLNHMEVYNDASPNTLKNYPIHLKAFFEFTQGEVSIDVKVFKKFTEYLLKVKSEARSTINARLSALRSYYKYLYNESIIHHNVATKIAFVKQLQNPVMEVLDQQDVFKSLDRISDVRDRALFETLYSTGVRESELSNLNIENIDFENELVIVIHGKGKKTRVTPISKDALKWIKAYVGTRKTGPLFLNPRGQRLGYKSIYNLCVLYFEVSPHKLRHAFATHMMEATGNTKAVSEMLGHATAKFTEKRYVHLKGKNLSRIYKNSKGMER